MPRDGEAVAASVRCALPQGRKAAFCWCHCGQGAAHRCQCWCMHTAQQQSAELAVDPGRLLAAVMAMLTGATLYSLGRGCIRAALTKPVLTMVGQTAPMRWPFFSSMGAASCIRPKVPSLAAGMQAEACAGLGWNRAAWRVLMTGRDPEGLDIVPLVEHVWGRCWAHAGATEACILQASCGPAVDTSRGVARAGYPACMQMSIPCSRGPPACPVAGIWRGWLHECHRRRCDQDDSCTSRPALCMMCTLLCSGTQFGMAQAAGKGPAQACADAGLA